MSPPEKRAGLRQVKFGDSKVREMAIFVDGLEARGIALDLFNWWATSEEIM